MPALNRVEERTRTAKKYCAKTKQLLYTKLQARVLGKRSWGYAHLKTWVQEVPNAKSEKSRETDRTLDVRGIVRRAGEWRPARQSRGTQYSKPPSVSLTQPLVSGCKRNVECIGLEEEEIGIGTNATESGT